MNKITTSNTSTKKSLLAGFLDETRAASRRSDATSAVQAKADGKAGSVMGSTATDPKPVQTFLSDALEKALAATNAAKSDVSTARAKAGGFTGATAGQTTTAYASQQTQNRLKDAVGTAIAQVNAMKATNDSYVDEQTVRPTAEQKRQAALVARLPEDFPIDEWESLPTKAQLKKMQNTRLSKTEQWDLLNTKTSMSTLRDIGEQTASQTAMLQAAVDRIMNGEVTNSSKLTPLQQRVLDRQLEKEEEAMRSVAGQSKTVASNNGRKDIDDFPAVQYMLGDGEITAEQSDALQQAQDILYRLYASGTATQQQIDNVIAYACTSLLNDENAPRTIDGNDQQKEIPAYTDAIDGLLVRLRRDAEEVKTEIKNTPRSSNRRLAKELELTIDFINKNLEEGGLDFRSQGSWDAMITYYSPDAEPLGGSQYLFVYQGSVYTSEDLGNIIYGYYGKGLGFSSLALYVGAGGAASVKALMDENPETAPDLTNGYLGDNEEDRAMIDLGISWYREGR